MATTPTPLATPTPALVVTPTSLPDPHAAMQAAFASVLTAEGMVLPTVLPGHTPNPPNVGGGAPLVPPLAPSATPTPVVASPAPVVEPPVVAPSTPPLDDDFQLRDPNDPALATTPAGVAVPQVDPTTTPLPVESTPTPTPTDQALQNLASLLADPTSVPNPDLLDERLRGAFLATNSGKRIYSHMKGMHELSKSPDEGGLGVLPSPDQIRTWHADHARLSDLTYQIESGNPQAASEAFRYLFTAPDPTDPSQQTLRPGLEAALPTIFGEIATLSRAANRPDLYHRAVAPVHQAKWDSLMTHVRSSFPGGEPGSDAQQWRDVMVAAMIKLAPVYGQQIDAEAFTIRPSDPQARLVDENRRLQAQIQHNQTQATNAAWNSFYDAVSSIESPKLASYVDQSLAAIKPQFPPVVYHQLARTFYSECLDLLARDPHYNREAEPLLNRIYQTGQFLNGKSPELASQVARVQDQHLQRIVTGHRARLLSSLRGANASPSTQLQPTISLVTPGAPTLAQQQAAADAARYAAPGPGGSQPSAGGGILPQPEHFSAPPRGDLADAIAGDILRRTASAGPGRR